MMISMLIMILRNMTIGQTMMAVAAVVAMAVSIMIVAAHQVDVEVVQEEVVVVAEAEVEEVAEEADALRILHADQKTI